MLLNDFHCKVQAGWLILAFKLRFNGEHNAANNIPCMLVITRWVN